MTLPALLAKLERLAEAAANTPIGSYERVLLAAACSASAIRELVLEVRRMEGALQTMVDAFKHSNDELIDYELRAIEQARSILHPTQPQVQK